MSTLNLTAICAWVAQAIAERLHQRRPRIHHISFAHAVSEMKDSVLSLLLAAGVPGLLCPLVPAMAGNVEAVRPRRFAPQN